ncbi:interleukin-20 receptor subunit alpha-like isoform X1 [Stegostoma tigrinum]|uniref:interleukin-20 receptor subunit alpha-like isoform X1 n=1 Tax=Stegostoma tigrinum TaxID=3053191 RepID=UPI00202AF3CE|nr:interleukin-20 receptor subunit alpha-like isoform X1 [Stegostoma tigrinum]
MGTTYFLLLMLSLYGADAVLHPPRNLRFSSVNSENILHWDPPLDYSPAVRYDVQYFRYGWNVTYTPVSHCTGIPHHHCDLTQETWDFNMQIIARIRSFIGNVTSDWERSDMFKPLDSTSFGLAPFDVQAEHNIIRVNISAPTLHWGGRTRSMEELFNNSLMYIVLIRVNNTDKSEEFRSSGELNATMLQPGETYCIKVKAILSMDTREGNFTEEKCITIKIRDPALKATPNIIFGVISAVFILFTLSFCLGMFCWHYLKKKTTFPTVLKSLDKNKKSLSIMDYLSLIDDVVVQQMPADCTLLSSCKIQEQDDLWPELKIKEASSVDSGIDIGGNSSDQMTGFCEPLNPYMQQTPETSNQRNISARDTQDDSLPKESCLINVPEAVDVPTTGARTISPSGYQKQTPKTVAVSVQDESNVETQTVQDIGPSFISTSDIDMTGFSRGFLSLDDVLLMDNGQ